MRNTSESKREREKERRKERERKKFGKEREREKKIWERERERGRSGSLSQWIQTIIIIPVIVVGLLRRRKQVSKYRDGLTHSTCILFASILFWEGRERKRRGREREERERKKEKREE